MSEPRKEQAKLAYGDAHIVEELAGWLRAFSFEVDAGGRDGRIELEKVRELARDAIKRIVNYI